MLERKSFVGKSRNYGESIKYRLPCRFSRLFQNAEISLPVDLQKFISSEKHILTGELPKNNVNKVRVILKINESKDTTSCLMVNKNQNCIGLIDPTPSRKTHTSNNNVNMFPFDSIFTESDQKDSLVANSLIDPIQNLFQGRDSCIFTFGNSGLGKTKTMIGSDKSLSDLGVIPSAMAWIFQMLSQLGSSSSKNRYSIKISAMEIANKNSVRDLLSDSTVNNTAVLSSSSSSSSIGDVARPSDDDTILSSSNQTQLPATRVQEAARILDHVLAARSSDNDSLTHLQLIIHMYRYKIDTGTSSDEFLTKPPAILSRSRLKFLDLGSGRHGNDDSSILSLQGISKVILALYTSQRHVPYRDNVLTQLLKHTIEQTNEVTTMLVHISNKEQHYNDTLQIVQLASKIYRTRSRKSRSVGFILPEENASCSSSSSGFHSRRLRPHMGIGATRRSSGNSSASSEWDLTSASELSTCETVIFRDNGKDQVKSLTGNLMATLSESNVAISDKESSVDYLSCSSVALSPAALRRRRVSPRTNARAWPSANVAPSSTPDDGPEMWVDGPKAVYEKEIIEREILITKAEKVQPVPSNIVKPLMVTKETQCDEVWDSGSSVTDDSSHSNTMDRKDNRPLSDISECTEDTESVLDTECDINRINNDTCPINELDDLLDSTLGFDPYTDNISAKNQVSIHDFGHFTNIPCVSVTRPMIGELGNFTSTSEATKFDSTMCGPTSHLTNYETENTHTNIDSRNVKKYYHSASESKRSSKSEQKEKKKKSKCKKCSKKCDDKPLKPMAISNSTDFSRVKKWIQSVEYEIQSSTNNSKLDFKSDQYNLDHEDRYQINRLQNPPNPLIKMEREVDNGNYSLYGGFQTHPTIREGQLYRTNQTQCYMQPSTFQTVCAVTVPPLVVSVEDHLPPSNISYNDHYVTTMAGSLLPLPFQHDISQIPLRNVKPTIATSSPPVHQQKCKTLPRDIYSDAVCNKKCSADRHECHNSRSANRDQQRVQSIARMEFDRSRNKRESKNIFSILLTPFVNLRNKINKSKSNLEKQKNRSENDLETCLKRDISMPLVSEWPMMDSVMGPELTISNPYHLVTSPKTRALPTDSSGVGSDSSSVQNKVISKVRSWDASKHHHLRNSCHTSKDRQRPSSSGYGSIIIKGDSEVSSHNDSSSEYSISGPRIINSHSRMKQSISLTNCKSFVENQTKSPLWTRNNEIRESNITAAEDIIIREKLRISQNNERKIVIEYIEANRMMGLPVDASVMNLTCFKSADKTTSHDKCQSMIHQIDHEIEQLKQKLSQSQQHLLLITSFDSNIKQ